MLLIELACMDIVIVNWNSGLQIKTCVESLKNQCRAIVVDNASSDGSASAVSHLSGVELVRAKENLGFGKACNLGAQHTRDDYLLFLNPDAAVYADTLENSLAFMQDPSNADVGICGVQLKDETGHVARSCARFPTPWGFVAHAVGLDRFFPRLGHFMAEWPHDSTRDVDHVIGAFFLVRRSVFDALGGFDERFFLYLEDLDFSRRARQAGWRSVYLADVQAFHAGGGTSNQVRARRLFYSLRSRLLYAHKHFGAAGFALTCAATLLLEPLSRTALALGRRSAVACKETWAAYALLWRWLPQWVFKGVTR